MRKLNVLLAALLIGASLELRGQVAEALIDSEVAWSKGSVMLKDGKEMKGTLKYSDNTGVLSFQDGDNSRTLTPRNVIAFEFQDEDEGRQRIFYSLEDKEEDTDIKKWYFFEVLHEFQTFAVLSKVTPIQIDKTSNGSFNTATGFPVTGSSRVEVSQVEVISFMNQSGKLEPYLRVVEKEVDNGWYDYSSTKNKIIDDEVFPKYAGKHWPKVKAYAEENKLKFKRRSDFIKALKYLATLTK